MDSIGSNDVNFSTLILDYNSQNVTANVNVDANADVNLDDVNLDDVNLDDVNLDDVENDATIHNTANIDISLIDNNNDIDAEQSDDLTNQTIDDFCILNQNTNCTIHDAYIMIYAYSIRHDLSRTAIEDLIRLINSIIGSEKLASSKYFFKKKFGKANSIPEKHFTCYKCDLYLGTLNEIKDTQKKCCPNCSIEIQTDTKFKKNHFVTIPVRNQLKTVLEQNSDTLIFDFPPTSNYIRDVHDSLSFQKLKNNMENDATITLTLSTDGAALFKSTKEKSLWPIQYIINEIDLESRFKRQNMLCAGVSFGKTPNMQTFLKPFIDEILKINTDGGLSFKMNGEVKTVKIYPMIFTGDTLAKQYVLKKSSFNGYKGCPYCLHAGTLVQNQIRYCNRDLAAVRMNDQTRIDMFEAQATASKVNGYHGISPLIALEHFDVVQQVAIDKMHCIDMGVIKRLFNLFLDVKNRKKE